MVHMTVGIYYGSDSHFLSPSPVPSPWIISYRESPLCSVLWEPILNVTWIGLLCCLAPSNGKHFMLSWWKMDNIHSYQFTQIFAYRPPPHHLHLQLQVSACIVNCSTLDYELGFPNDWSIWTFGFDIVVCVWLCSVSFLKGYLENKDNLGVYPVSWSPGNSLWHSSWLWQTLGT